MIRIALTCATLLALALPSAASARSDVRIGIGDQSAAMFTHPDFRSIGLRQVRYFIHWNAMDHRAERLRARAYVKAARRAGARVLLHLSTDDLREKRGTLPSAKAYRRQADRLVRYFRALGVRDFGAWNEVNHKTQPTWDAPARAAAYFKAMRRAVFRRCSSRSCRVVGLDVLDQRGVERYIQRFVAAAGRRYVDRYLRVVGIHNYSDVNRRRTTGLRSILRTVRRANRGANFWLTETGALVRFGRSFPCSEQRAAGRLRFLFDTTRRYRRSLQRVYLYNWFGGDCQIRFDAGLVRADGTPRPSLAVLRDRIGDFRR